MMAWRHIEIFFNKQEQVMCDRDSGRAVAVFQQDNIVGEVLCENVGKTKVKLSAKFTRLPPGKHGFHIHRLGDLRGKGCQGACEHFHVGPPTPHGGPPGSSRQIPRHTGDLGNISMKSVSRSHRHHTRKNKPSFKKAYIIEGIQCEDLWGRSLIIHADEDDLGKGNSADSLTTGHSGARIGCAIFGRAA